jgi:heme a synthase
MTGLPAQRSAIRAVFDRARLPADDWRERLSDRQRRLLRIWFWSIAATTFAVLVIGGITRLTQSGLSIVDWDPLIGAVPPLNDAQWSEAFDRYRQFPEYRMRAGMTLAEFKTIFFWEYLHRLVARLIGAVFLIPFLAFWRAGYLVPPLRRRALLLFGLGGMQGIVGWLMVKSGLVDRPSVSHYRLAMHLGLALVILGFAVWLARDLAARPLAAAASGRARRFMVRGLTIVGVLLAAQILWGAFVAGTKAGLIFNTFPLMAGRFLPPGTSTVPGLLDLVQDPGTVQWVHRALGTVLLVSVAVFFTGVRRIAADRRSRRLNTALVWLIASQYLIGVLTLIFRLPVSLAALHQAMAAAIVAVWVIWTHHAIDLGTATRAQHPAASTPVARSA